MEQEAPDLLTAFLVTYGVMGNNLTAPHLNDLPTDSYKQALVICSDNFTIDPVSTFKRDDIRQRRSCQCKKYQ